MAIQIPNDTVGRTQPTNMGLSYASPQAGRPTAFGSALGPALGNVAQATASYAVYQQEQQAATQRFDVLRSFSNFTTQAEQRVMEMQRSSPQADFTLTDRVTDYYKQAEGEWLMSIPEEYRDEFEWRSSETFGRLQGQTANFQTKAGDLYFAQGVEDELGRSMLLLEGQPERLEAEQARITEIINATSLPAMVKQEQIRAAFARLQGRAYHDTLVARGEAGFSEMATDLIIDEEGGFYAETRYDVNHFRVGYSSDTITLPDGSVRTVQMGDTVTIEDAQRDLARRIEEERVQIIREVGGDVWGAIPPEAQAALVSVAYNYGTIPASVQRAMATGSMEAIANAVQSLRDNPERRAREADIIRGVSSVPPARLDSDPRFTNLPYEDRVALRGDAETAARAAVAERDRQALAARQAVFNSLLLNLNDGNAGQYEIDQWRLGQGASLKYEDLAKAQNVLEARNKHTADLSAAVANLKNPAYVWNPDLTENKNQLNAFARATGMNEQLAAMNQAFLADNIIPFVVQTQDIPTEMAGFLEGMTRRAGNPQQVEFAYNAMNQMMFAAPEAFRQRFDDQVEADVAFWQEQRGLGFGADQVMNAMRGGATPEERRAQHERRQEAQEFLRSTNSAYDSLDFPNIWEKAAAREFGVVGDRPRLPGISQEAFMADFQGFFTHEYTRRGDVNSARDAAIAHLQRTWGETRIGGQRAFVRHPPERMGYQQMAGNFDWIDRQVRSTYSIPEYENFQLLADSQTLAEYQQYHNSAFGTHLPSYRIIRLDAEGVPEVLPNRMYFEPTLQDRRMNRVKLELDSLRVQMETLRRPFLSGGVGSILPRGGEEILELHALNALIRAKELELETLSGGPAESP